MSDRGRGASYMNEYDNNDYDYADKDSGGAQFGGCTKCAKHCLFGVNFVMLLVGVALICVAVFSKQNNDNVGIGAVMDELIYLAIASGVLIVIVSFLGCVGATTHSKIILILYLVVVLLSFITECVVIGLVYSRSAGLKSYLGDQWKNEFSDSQKTKIEEKNKCCGFSDGDTCVDTTQTSADGCYTALYSQMNDNLTVLGGVAIGVACYQIIMAIFAMFFCVKLKKSEE